MRQDFSGVCKRLRRGQRQIGRSEPKKDVCCMVIYLQCTVLSSGSLNKPTAERIAKIGYPGNQCDITYQVFHYCDLHCPYSEHLYFELDSSFIAVWLAFFFLLYLLYLLVGRLHKMSSILIVIYELSPLCLAIFQTRAL